MRLSGNQRVLIMGVSTHLKGLAEILPILQAPLSIFALHFLHPLRPVFAYSTQKRASAIFTEGHKKTSTNNEWHNRKRPLRIGHKSGRVYDDSNYYKFITKDWRPGKIT